jgi:acyl-CoA synthetase (AMP-forming)/AMP-acid ligase II/pimeloyl-ACP methyl ester carboxylesterase
MLDGPSHNLLSESGLNPQWSRVVRFVGPSGRDVTWHVLDTGMTETTIATMVCVHGNPTWSYLYRDLLLALSPKWRVIAIDQSGMGYSERTEPRQLAERIEELVAFCRQVVTTPLYLAAHDWGGPVAVGATRHLPIEALILANTAVGQPENVAVPPLIAGFRRFVDVGCHRTPAFVRGTSWMTTRNHRRALNAPYRSASRRQAIVDFVADIPVENTHASRPALDGVGEAFEALTVPILLLWGAKDPVFHDRFLSDLRRRQPTATVERFEHSGHLVLLDGGVGPIVRDWLDRLTAKPFVGSRATAQHDGSVFASAFTSVERNAARQEALYQGPDGKLSWAELAEQAGVAASALTHEGIGRGHKVALLIPPSKELLIAAVALWRVGAIPVVVDPSSGLVALRRQLRAQAPRAVLGTTKSLIAAATLRWTPGAKRMGFGSRFAATDLSRPHGPIPSAVDLDADELAAIVHTSGATGPAKAVAYTHGSLVAQRTPIEQVLGKDGNGAFTSSFAAFSLLAPALERAVLRPDVPVDQPSKLGFEELQVLTRSRAIDVAWLSPASARQLVATAKGRTLPISRVLLAGAPIPPALANAVGRITKGIVLSPYGMTECLPITTGVGTGEVHPSGGVVVGPPVDGATVKLRDLSTGAVFDTSGAFGEILVAAPWMYDFYDQRNTANVSATVLLEGVRFHATGDVGLFDGERLVVLGRLRDVAHTEHGPVAPLTIEDPVGRALNQDVAMVGVGPNGAEVLVVIVSAKNKTLELAEASVAQQARAASTLPLAAVLVGRLPVDHRHQSKVDHLALKKAAHAVLQGS